MILCIICCLDVCYVSVCGVLFMRLLVFVRYGSYDLYILL